MGLPPPRTKKEDMTKHLGVGDGGLQIETAIRIHCQLGVAANFRQHGLDAPAIFRDIGSADLHLHHGVSAVEIAAHFRTQRLQILSRIVVAAGGVDKDTRIGLCAIAFGKQPEERLAGNFRHRIPHRHIDRADGYGAFAVPPGFSLRINVCQIRSGSRLSQHRSAGNPAWPPATGARSARESSRPGHRAVGVESVTNDRSSIAYDIGDHGDQGAGHPGKIDIGVGDGGCHGAVTSRKSAIRMKSSPFFGECIPEIRWVIFRRDNSRARGWTFNFVSLPVTNNGVPHSSQNRA